jgi:hypothetical protein
MIKISDINAYLGYQPNRRSSLGSPEFRALAQIPTGEIKISDFIEPISGIKELDIASVNAVWTPYAPSAGHNGLIAVGATGKAYAEPYKIVQVNSPWTASVVSVGDHDIAVYGNAKNVEGIAEHTLRATKEPWSGAGANGTPVSGYNFTWPDQNTAEMNVIWPALMSADYNTVYGIGNITAVGSTASIVSHPANLFSRTALYGTAPDGSDIRHQLLIVPSTYVDPNKRDMMVLTDDGANTLYWYAPDLASHTGWVLKHTRAGRTLANKILRGFKDQDNWAFATTDNKIVIMRGGVVTEIAVSGYVGNVFWNQNNDYVYWVLNGKVYESDTSNSVLIRLEFPVSSGFTFINTKGMMARVQSGVSGVYHYSRYDKNFVLVDTLTQFSSLELTDFWCPVWYGRDGTTMIFPTGIYSGTQRIDRGALRLYVPAVSAYAETVERTNAFVLLNPQYADEWEATKTFDVANGLALT